MTQTDYHYEYGEVERPKGKEQILNRKYQDILKTFQLVNGKNLWTQIVHMSAMMMTTLTM